MTKQNQNGRGLLEGLLFDQDFDALNDLIRWNATTRIKDESVAHHSYWVTIYTRILAAEIGFDEAETLRVVELALFHDADEMFTGDILHGVKYNEHNGEEMRHLLDEYTSKRIIDKFATPPYENTKTGAMLMRSMLGVGHQKGDVPLFKLVIKFADWLALLQYLIKEIRLGNKDMHSRLQYCISKMCMKADEICQTIEGVNKSNITMLNPIRLNCDVFREYLSPTTVLNRIESKL